MCGALHTRFGGIIYQSGADSTPTRVCTFTRTCQLTAIYCRERRSSCGVAWRALPSFPEASSVCSPSFRSERWKTLNAVSGGQARSCLDSIRLWIYFTPDVGSKIFWAGGERMRAYAIREWEICTIINSVLVLIVRSQSNCLQVLRSSGFRVGY